MRLSREARKMSRQLFKDSLVEGCVDEARAAAIVRAVADRKPRHYLAILKDFLRLVRNDLESRRARIESAAPLSPQERDTVTASVKAKFGHAITAEFSENPALLGGLRMQVGSDVWDGTVRNRLDILAASL